jgi:hypothetical protein
VKVLPIPAEKFQVGLSFDTIICWNAIDHAVGWREILNSIVNYARPEARIGIATDFHEPFDGHPGFERPDFFAEIEKRFTIVDQREPFGRALALLLKVKHG